MTQQTVPEKKLRARYTTGKGAEVSSITIGHSAVKSSGLHQLPPVKFPNVLQPLLVLVS
jgi:hypothetical protein